MSAPKARVYKDATFLGHPAWRWEHACRWMGYARNYSYPQGSWRIAYDAALRHVRGCK